MSNACAKIIPFPTSPAALSKPKPKALPHPDAVSTKREEREARAQAWGVVFDDIKGSGLEPLTCLILRILAHHACEQGWSHAGPMPVDQLNSVRDTKLTRGELAAGIRQIRGATFAGLGLDYRPFQYFAIWLWTLIEEGEDPWRQQRRQRKRE